MSGEPELGEVSEDEGDSKPYIGYDKNKNPILFFDPSGYPIHGYAKPTETNKEIEQ